MNPFEAYAGKARTIVERPAALIGSIKTRAEARIVYDEMVARITAFRCRAELTAYLAQSEARILQFHAELPFLWEGDGEDFLGLEREIESAFETVEAAEYFQRGCFRDGRGGAVFSKIRAMPRCEAGRLPGQLEQGSRA